MMVFELRRMPPMICGHPDLIPGWITPDGGGPPEPKETLLYIPEKIEFPEPEGYDEFTADLMYAFRRPIRLPWRTDMSIGSRAVVDDWIMENEPEWLAEDRPIALRHEIRMSLLEEFMLDEEFAPYFAPFDPSDITITNIGSAL